MAFGSFSSSATEVKTSLSIESVLFMTANLSLAFLSLLHKTLSAWILSGILKSVSFGCFMHGVVVTSIKVPFSNSRAIWNRTRYLFFPAPRKPFERLFTFSHLYWILHPTSDLYWCSPRTTNTPVYSSFLFKAPAKIEALAPMIAPYDV